MILVDMIAPTFIGYPTIIEATSIARESGRLFPLKLESILLHTKVCHPLSSKLRVARRIGTPDVIHGGGGPGEVKISASEGRAASPKANFSKY